MHVFKSLDSKDFTQDKKISYFFCYIRISEAKLAIYLLTLFTKSNTENLFSHGHKGPNEEVGVIIKNIQQEMPVYIAKIEFITVRKELLII